MKLFTITLMAMLLTFPCASFAGYYSPTGHGGHGCHSGGHSHAHSHSGGHSSSYHSWGHYNHYNHSDRYSRSGNDGYRGANVIVDPRRGTNEFDAGLGEASVLQFSEGSTAKFSTPVLTGSYHYYVSDHVALGVAFGEQAVAGTDTCKCTVSSPLLYNYSANAFTMAASMNVILSTGKWYQAYLGLDAGVTMLHEYDAYTDNTSSDITLYKFTGQASLGFRAGRALGGFMEFGVGYKGLINMGVSYQAGWKKAHRYM